MKMENEEYRTIPAQRESGPFEVSIDTGPSRPDAEHSELSRLLLVEWALRVEIALTRLLGEQATGVETTIADYERASPNKVLGALGVTLYNLYSTFTNPEPERVNDTISDHDLIPFIDSMLGRDNGNSGEIASSLQHFVTAARTDYLPMLQGKFGETWDKVPQYQRFLMAAGIHHEHRPLMQSA